MEQDGSLSLCGEPQPDSTKVSSGGGVTQPGTPGRAHSSRFVLEPCVPPLDFFFYICIFNIWSSGKEWRELSARVAMAPYLLFLSEAVKGVVRL